MQTYKPIFKQRTYKRASGTEYQGGCRSQPCYVYTRARTYTKIRTSTRLYNRTPIQTCSLINTHAYKHTRQQKHVQEYHFSMDTNDGYNSRVCGSFRTEDHL